MPTFRQDTKIGGMVPMMKTDDINDQAITKDKIRDGNVTAEKLADGAVSTDKLPDGAIKTPKIADGNITTSKLAEASVITSKIADQNVTKEKIADQSVDNSKLSPEAVTYDKLKDKSVITEKLNDRAVTTEKIEEKAITNTKLGDQSVDGRVVREASIEGKHLGNNAVSTSKIASRSVTNEKIAFNSVSRAELTPDVRNSIDKKADAEQVNNSLYDLEKKIGERFVVEGDVTNLPDEEDLTSVKESEHDVLKLADRIYAPEKFSGKGYKILRRNIQPVSIAVTKIQIETVPSADGTLSFTVNGKETQVAVSATTDNTTALVSQKVASAFQESMTEYEVSTDTSLITLTRKSDGSVTPSVFSASTTGVVCTVTDSTKREFRNILMPNMINQPNTIYKIRYDFTLSEDITVPDNCVLEFDGGKILSGGEGKNTIKGNNTRIEAQLTYIFDSSLVFIGYWVIKEVYPQWFNNGNDLNALNAALNFKIYYDPVHWPDSPTYANVNLGNDSYNIASTITVPTGGSGKRKIYSKEKSTIYYTGTGNCFEITRPLTQRGRIIFEGFTIVGVDSTKGYRPISERTSNGAGFVISSSSVSFKNIEVAGFKTAILIHTGHNNIIDSCLLWFNKYGIWFDNNTANMNIIEDTIIRENYGNGIRITTDKATFNNFDRCEIESNQPYLEADIASDNGIGIYLTHSYNNKFNGCYFEGSYNGFVYLDTDTKENVFTNLHFDNNHNYSMEGQQPCIKFNGDSRRNIFSKCVSLTLGPSDTTPLVTYVGDTIPESLYENTIENCYGLYIDRSLLESKGPKFINCNRSSSYGGSSYDRARFGMGINYLGSSLNDDVPNIDGVGTNNATLYVKGYGMVAVDKVSSSTTITNIVGLKKGEFILISNYSTDGSLTLALPRMKTPLVFNKINQSIIIARDSFDDIIEICRNEM